MFTLLFYLHAMAATLKLVARFDKVTSKDEYPIYIRLTKDRKASYISTGIKVLKKHWDVNNSRVKPSYPNSARLNNFLQNELLKYENLSLKEQTDASTISAKHLKNKLTGKNVVDFFTVHARLVTRYTDAKQVHTVSNVNSVAKKLATYVKATSLPLSAITPEFLASYESYLRTKLGNTTNTVHKDFKYLRRVFNESYKMGLIDYSQNPFTRFQFRSAKTHRTYLTAKELESIENATHLTQQEQLIRDMFVFSAYSGGIRISDTLLLKNKDFDGGSIHFHIQKTRGQLAIKLPSKALSIVHKYGAVDRSEDFIFPMLPAKLDVQDPHAVDLAISRSTASINKLLKQIAKKTQLTKPLSFHVARHTWGTLALQKGISIDKVSKLMGHSSVRETQIYAKIMSEELDKAMDLFND